MIVNFTDSADVDLEELADWIAYDNPERAASFALEIRDRCFHLSDFPARFPIVRELAGYTLHKMTHGRFLIFYSVLEDRIDVTRIIRASRDWQQLLDDA